MTDASITEARGAALRLAFFIGTVEGRLGKEAVQESMDDLKVLGHLLDEAELTKTAGN